MMKLVCKATGVVVNATDEQAAILISGGFEPADGREPVGEAESADEKTAEPAEEKTAGAPELEGDGSEDVADGEDGDEPDLDAMNFMKLKSYAKSEYGLTFSATAKRPEIVKAIEEARAARRA